MSHPFNEVLIVGAGPSGLLLSLLLSKHGIKTHILEASHALDPRPRAAVYGPASIPDLKRAGILSLVRERGITLGATTWRREEDLATITGFEGEVLRDVGGEDWRMTCLPLQELDGLMLEVYTGEYGGRVSWGHGVVEVGQDGDRAWVDVETDEGMKRIGADYVIGCDGANSVVRKSLFGDEFPGFTWDDQIVATNTYYDFDRFGFGDISFIIHPLRFYMACRLDNHGLYRVTYGECPELSPAEMRSRLPEKFSHMLPGNPSPSDYRVAGFSTYKMHQRCAPSFRVGRVLLVADAAHVCNPWGGLGITGGFVDVGGLYECLAGYYDGKADESILDVYSEVRRRKWREVIDPVSQANFNRVTKRDGSEFLRACKGVEGDEEGTRRMLMGFFDVRYDFTQHYQGIGQEAQGT